MLSNYKVIQYSILFLFLVYIGKSINFTKNGIIATLLATCVVIVLYYSDTSNHKITEKKVKKIYETMNLDKYPYLSIEPRIINILRYLKDYENKKTYYRILRLCNAFLKNYYIVYSGYQKHNHKNIENTILLRKKILNELSSISISVPTNQEFQTKIKTATKKMHIILNTYINNMTVIHDKFWKTKKIDINYNPINIRKGPYPDDTATLSYDEHFSLY